MQLLIALYFVLFVVVSGLVFGFVLRDVIHIYVPEEKFRTWFAIAMLLVVIGLGFISNLFPTAEMEAFYMNFPSPLLAPLQKIIGGLIFLLCFARGWRWNRRVVADDLR